MTLTDKEKEILADNFRAFVRTFGSVRIERESPGRGFCVYCPADRPDGDYVQYCYNISYLDGWLYGAVQAANKIVKRIERND